jgi:divalent metal cation (Fe/Co/Zn/Cd) transporter
MRGRSATAPAVRSPTNTPLPCRETIRPSSRSSRIAGHHLRAECEVIVDAGASAVQAHQVAVNAEHNLLHAVPGWGTLPALP